MTVSRPSSAQVARTGKQRDWKTGLILDYEKSRNVYTTGSTTSAETNGSISPAPGGGASVHAETTATATVHHVAINTTDLFIIGDQYVYEVEDATRRGGGGGVIGLVAQAIVNRKHGCRFVVGEEIRYAQEKGYLYVIDPDGKECKAEILRQEKRR